MASSAFNSLRGYVCLPEKRNLLVRLLQRLVEELVEFEDRDTVWDSIRSLDEAPRIRAKFSTAPTKTKA